MRRSSLDRIDVAISREIDSKFDSVKTVADNIADVVTVADSINNSLLGNVVDVIGTYGSSITIVADNIDNVVLAAENTANINSAVANSDNINIISTNIADVNILADALGTATISGGGQFLGTSVIKGIQYMSQTLAEPIIVPSGLNAFSIDNLEILSGGSITVSNDAVYKVL